MSLSAYVVWFSLASVAGWLYETTYCIIRTGGWERRGFLFGPLCPIYGTGVVAGLLLFNRPEVASGAFPAWGVFLVSMVGSAILEYGVSVVLERLFGALWWDYSDMPLNINGRICLPASLLFGAAGVLVAYVLVPLIGGATARVQPQVFEVLALVAVALLSCDMTASAISLSDLMEKIIGIDRSANRYASMRVDHAIGTVRAVPERVSVGVHEVVGQVKDGGSEVASRIEGVRDTAAQRLDDAVVSQQARMARVADGLTERQVQMLAHLRRFRSEDVRAKAEALRQTLKRRSEGDNGTNG